MTFVYHERDLSKSHRHIFIGQNYESKFIFVEDKLGYIVAKITEEVYTDLISENINLLESFIHVSSSIYAGDFDGELDTDHPLYYDGELLPVHDAYASVPTKFLSELQ